MFNNKSDTELKKGIVWQDKFIQYSNNFPPGRNSGNGGSKEVYRHDGSGKFSRKHGNSDIIWKVDNPHVKDGVVVVFEDRKVPEGSPDAFSIWEQGSAARAIVVRLLLICHNLVSVWRVAEEYKENLYWLLAVLNVFLIVEGVYVVVKRQGVDYKWWCPCFFFYLTTTLPAVWLLQVRLHDQFVGDTPADTLQAGVSTVAASGPNTTSQTTPPTTSLGVNYTVTTMYNVTTNVNVTDNAANRLVNSSNVVTASDYQSPGSDISLDTWVIIIQETLIYLIVFCRWIIPRGEVSREFLADLLLEFLAIACDIMELLAVFDEEEVRSNLQLTFVVMAVWSASFIQFVPNLVHKRQFRHIKSPRIKSITRACGDQFIEVIVTCMGIFLQDGPFLVVRLYIMITLQLFTYSLVFFVLKNMVTLILLFYRLSVMTYRLPCCIKIRRKNELETMFPGLKTKKVKSEAEYA